MIKMLYHRGAAPKKGRPSQWRAQLVDGSLVDLPDDSEVVIDANRLGLKSYAGYQSLPDDAPGDAQWARWRLGENQLEVST